MRKRIKALSGSRYAHLCAFLAVLAGVSWGATHATTYERVLNSVGQYCRADYMVRKSISPEERVEAEYYRDQYKGRMQSLTAGLFDHRDGSKKREFFLSGGYLYDEWQDKGESSYLLAKIVDRGSHEMGIPARVRFDYVVLGEEKVVPLVQARHGRKAGPFVSSGEREVYVHRDRLERILRRYFERLWDSEIRGEEDFHWNELSYCLYRDLREICEDVFVKRRYRGRACAMERFVEEGFGVYLPTLLAMGARMAADQDLELKPGDRYQRALMTGLALSPNHTMLRLTMENPSLPKLQKELKARLRFGSYADRRDQVTLDEIARAAQDVFDKMEAAADHRS